MKKILAFAGSNSKNSINKQLVKYTATLIEKESTTIVDLNDFSLPLFSVDLEKESGFPENAIKFDKLLQEVDGIILSLAEHNGSYTAVFKNLFDWLSRIEPKLWRNKPMLLMAASPGGRGGKGVLAAATERFPRHNSNIVASFSLPNFNENYKGELTNDKLQQEFQQAIHQFQLAL